VIVHYIVATVIVMVAIFVDSNNCFGVLMSKKIVPSVVKSGHDLLELFEGSSFVDDPDVGFSGMEIKSVDEDDGDYPLNLYVYVPECSTFGHTLIMLSGDYEDSGVDCLFLQELVKAYASGKLKYQS